ncbi:Tigger transposable element-derived protein 4 [Dictyocoela muelleri]|nr:Tigger transposable element-derived protein 4 [Dictyocoela muelleri]
MYKQANKRTYIFKKDDIANGKFSKERVSILFAVSKAGEKLTPLLIAKSKSPRCFKNIKIDNHPVIYEHNLKSWMTMNIFIRLLEKINSYIKKQKRKILMLIDNAPVHPKDLELSNIELFYFLPNTTSLVQPLDQEILKAFKDGYKKIWELF